ncbi:MAG TPA: UDP-N-acetylmuramoyl-tripeptide--D-alanyl-D-alanine ligase [bacterium]|nr:UDP-N-acetylmuramoyl-tripeptide--D-alanyl-D-alanine ligase [bacterium]
MRYLIQKVLYFFSKAILKKYHPDVIGVTGSVGKTSAKEAIHTVLKNKYNTRTNLKNYNTEFGVPLTIINSPSGQHNPFKWLIIFLKALFLILFKTKKYPDVLVLEMAADHPGDIAYLAKLTQPHLGVITAIGPSHLEFFNTIEEVIKEKETLIRFLKTDDWAILNNDDSLVIGMKKNTTAKIFTFGLTSAANIRAEKVNFEKDGSGVMAEIICAGESNFASFKNVLSTSQLDSFLIALSVGKIYGIPLSEAVDSLRDFSFPPGRLNLIKGIKNTTLIDDTYNSSPKAVKVALSVLSRLSCSNRRWAVLGDMLELGSLTESAHEEVGEWVKQFKVDILVTVGEKSKDTAKIAEINGLSREKVLSFNNSIEAGKFLQNEIMTGDVILVKGSQGMRMEKIVKELMGEPLRAKELLVRQEDYWLKK